MNTNGTDFSTALERLMRELSARNPQLSAQARIMSAWQRASSTQVLEHTDAVYVVPDSDEGEVIVFIDSPIWAAELNMQSELLRLKLNVELNEMIGAPTRPAAQIGEHLFDTADGEHIRRLRFIPSNERYKSSSAFAMPDYMADEQDGAVSPLPLTDDELDALMCQVSHIEDEHVRQAAFEAGKKSLELIKGRGEGTNSIESKN